MDECIVCGDKALHICQPCNASFCDEHKGLHEKNKNKEHIFEEIRIKLDSSRTKRIAENLILKINELKEFENRIILETSILIQTIEELCTTCLKNSADKVQFCMDLLEKIQNSITEQDLTTIENKINFSFSLCVPTPSLKEILNFYDIKFDQEPPEISTHGLEKLKFMTADNIKQALIQEFNLYLEGHTRSINCVSSPVTIST